MSSEPQTESRPDPRRWPDDLRERVERALQVAGEREMTAHLGDGPVTRQWGDHILDALWETGLTVRPEPTNTQEAEAERNAALPSMKCVCGHWDTEHAAFVSRVRPGRTRTFCDHCDCASWMTPEDKAEIDRQRSRATVR